MSARGEDPPRRSNYAAREPARPPPPPSLERGNNTPCEIIADRLTTPLLPRLAEARSRNNVEPSRATFNGSQAIFSPRRYPAEFPPASPHLLMGSLPSREVAGMRNRDSPKRQTFQREVAPSEIRGRKRWILSRGTETKTETETETERERERDRPKFPIRLEKKFQKFSHNFP